MPELSEVNSLANDMRRMVRNGTVVSVVYSPWYLTSRVAKRPAASLNAIVGSTIANIKRVGKAIVFEVKAPDAEFFVANRLGMTGTWRAGSKPDFPHMVLALELRLEGQTIFLVYTDVRKFGTFECRNSLAALESLRIYGPEITSTMFTLEWVVFVVSRHKLPIKVILLEQAYFAGMSNSLANEVLFRANIHPEHPSHTLDQDQVRRLFTAIHILMYSDSISFLVYRRSGKPCAVCGGLIKLISVSKRHKSYFCEKCQSMNWKPPLVTNSFVHELVEILHEKTD